MVGAFSTEWKMVGAFSTLLASLLFFDALEWNVAENGGVDIGMEHLTQHRKYVSAATESIEAVGQKVEKARDPEQSAYEPDNLAVGSEELTDSDPGHKLLDETNEDTAIKLSSARLSKHSSANKPVTDRNDSPEHPQTEDIPRNKSVEVSRVQPFSTWAPTVITPLAATTAIVVKIPSSTRAGSSGTSSLQQLGADVVDSSSAPVIQEVPSSPRRWWWQSAPVPTVAPQSVDVASNTTRPTWRLLRLLCAFGDAGVQATDSNCSDIRVPQGYVEICGHRQCSDRRIDHCLLTEPPGGGRWVGRVMSALSTPSFSTSFSGKPTLIGEKVVRAGQEAVQGEATVFEPRQVPTEIILPRLKHQLGKRQKSGRRRSRQCPLSARTCSNNSASRVTPRPSRSLFKFKSECDVSDQNLHIADQCAAVADKEESAKTNGTGNETSVNSDGSGDLPQSDTSERCRSYELFTQCDAYRAPLLSWVWNSIGANLATKLLTGDTGTENNDADVDDTLRENRWIHCADEGQLCNCVGQIRFGGSGQWAPETLHVSTGLLHCVPATFAGSDSLDGTSYQWCECFVPRTRGYLVLPSNDTVQIQGHVGKLNAENAKVRFIAGQAYPRDILNGIRYDYASTGAGARIVTHSKELKNAKAVLSPDKSEYMLTSCDQRTWFVVSLLDLLSLEYVGLISLEMFANGLRHLQILGSRTYPTDEWVLLGEVETNATTAYEMFDIGSRCKRQEKGCWVRYIKVRVLSHHNIEDNSFCALTRFQAFGSTQSDFIAEEQDNKPSVDSRLEPTVGDVIGWHDDVVRVALGDLVLQGAQDLEDDSTARSIWDDAVVASFGVPSARQSSSASQDGEDPNRNGDLSSEITDGLRNNQRDAKPLSMLKSALSWIKSQALRRPQISSGQDDSTAESPMTFAAVSNFQPSGLDPRAASERAMEILSELNTSLNGAPASVSAAGAAALAANAAKNNKTGNSLPPLVQIRDDLRDVQASHAVLQEDLRSVATALRETVMLVRNVSDSSMAEMQDLRRTGADTRPPLVSIPSMLNVDVEWLSHTDFFRSILNSGTPYWIILLLLVWNIRLEIQARRAIAFYQASEVTTLTSVEAPVRGKIKQSLAGFSRFRFLSRGRVPPRRSPPRDRSQAFDARRRMTELVFTRPAPLIASSDGESPETSSHGRAVQRSVLHEPFQDTYVGAPPSPHGSLGASDKDFSCIGGDDVEECLHRQSSHLVSQTVATLGLPRMSETTVVPTPNSQNIFSKVATRVQRRQSSVARRHVKPNVR